MSILLLTACRTTAPTPAVAPPRIGVTGSTPALADALRRFGATVVEIEPGDAEPDAIVGELSGLVLGPGDDLDPALYGQTPDPTDRLVPTDRQDQDLGLARAAFERDLPLLGICLGSQEIAVFLGGSLIQDIPSQVANAVDHRAIHSLSIAPGTPLATWYGAPSILVVSNHHQAVDRVPSGVSVAARAPDGVVEAIVVGGHRWAVGLQYHPEVDESQVQDPMWRSLVEAARHL